MFKTFLTGDLRSEIEGSDIRKCAMNRTVHLSDQIGHHLDRRRVRVSEKMKMKMKRQCRDTYTELGYIPAVPVWRGDSSVGVTRMT
jgi:hypothetical protein